MTNSELDKVLNELEINCDRILGGRNAVYAKGQTDALHNFKAGAEVAGVTPAQAAWGYMTKHTVALRDMVLRNDFSDMGQLKEKCTDMINYIKFIYALGYEENHKLCKHSGRNMTGELFVDSVPGQMNLFESNEDTEDLM